MSIAVYLILVFAFAIVVLYLRRPHLFAEIKESIAGAWEEAKADVEQQRASSNEEGDAVSDPEAEEVIAWYHAQARPAVLLRPDATLDPRNAPARLGGEVWLAEGEEWPRGRDGRPLEYVAQVDFARLPPLAGFPSAGVARFFVGRDDLWGADWDAPEQSNVRVLFHDGPQSGGRLQPPLEWGENDLSPFESESVRSSGLALRAEPADDLPDFYSWQVQERLDAVAGRAGQDELEDRLFDIQEARPMAHRVGGHPSFTQYDWRKRGQHDELDVVLLALTSDETIMWGDVGEAAFYIRAEDLQRRDFSRVAFYWDCH